MDKFLKEILKIVGTILVLSLVINFIWASNSPVICFANDVVTNVTDEENSVRMSVVPTVGCGKILSSPPYYKKAKGVYVIVIASITNCAKEHLTVNASEFRLVNAKTRAFYPYDWTATMALPNKPGSMIETEFTVTINPDMTKHLAFVFDVPDKTLYQNWILEWDHWGRNHRNIKVPFTVKNIINVNETPQSQSPYGIKKETVEWQKDISYNK